MDWFGGVVEWLAAWIWSALPGSVVFCGGGAFLRAAGTCPAPWSLCWPAISARPSAFLLDAGVMEETMEVGLAVVSAADKSAWDSSMCCWIWQQQLRQLGICNRILRSVAFISQHVFISFSCKLCRMPSGLNSCSWRHEFHAYFGMPLSATSVGEELLGVLCFQIECEGADHRCSADALMPDVGYGDAVHSALAGGAFAPTPSFSTQLAGLFGVRRYVVVALILAVLEVFLQGFVTTMLTPVLLQHQWRRRPRTPCLVSSNGFSKLRMVLSRCNTSGPLQASVHVVFAIFVPLGLIRRRRVRAYLKSVLRFSGEDISVLSSVMHPLDLQLNPLPQMRLPTRLLVEPLALRLARLQEAPEEYDCKVLRVRVLARPPGRLQLCSSA